ncbi:spermatogenesis-associated protein 17 isoform X3 [Acanthochromis polyacanthus]|uniref:spermatogenesis-associated protein 17 isoform X3 n=1 Tax=Acanthochromis polyacanthus TaxID=80966 RepID=UPI0022346E7D|nr:spermatogenesis-associated protein 17 isoform X3 [Acanthochromis polyacanthus]
MVELLKIGSEITEFPKELFYRNSQVEDTRQRENQVATQIQSWFRACKVRAYLSHLHKKAIIIQKIWRGFTARARVRQMVKAAYFIMKMNFYEEMAVRIQRRWRGFFQRKYIHNFYARKSYLEGVAIKNILVRRKLDKLNEVQKRERDCRAMVKEQEGKVYQAQRLHHLMSTKQCPGVFNSPFRQAPHEMELLLRQVKYQVPTRLAPRGRVRPQGTPSPTALSFPGNLGSPWIKNSRTCCSRPVLPPITSKKQQGLSREPGEVWEQQVQCPDLMLSLQTSYTYLEEAQNQLQQQETPFKTVFATFNIFDKFARLYSKGTCGKKCRMSPNNSGGRKTEHMAELLGEEEMALSNTHHSIYSCSLSSGLLPLLHTD